MEEKNKKIVSPDRENKKSRLTAPKKGWWRRYLDRLNKATDGKPPKCCG